MIFTPLLSLYLRQALICVAQSYSQCEQLLDVDAATGSGVYCPDVPDPEMSCSSSTSLWELADLRVSSASESLAPSTAHMPLEPITASVTTEAPPPHVYC